MSDALRLVAAPESPSDGSQAGQESSGPCPRVLIVSDVRFYREGLSEALSRLSRVVVAATAEDGDQALRCALALHPDAILLDAGLPNGLSIVASLTDAVSAIPIIALGVAESDHAVLAWAEAGVAGYVHRSASIAELIDTTALAIRGEQACSTKIGAAILRRLHWLAATASHNQCRLTPREQEIAQLVAEGLSNKLIARRLRIGVATAKCHIHHILDKLQFHRRSELARWVWGRLPVPDHETPVPVVGTSKPGGSGAVLSGCGGRLRRGA